METQDGLARVAACSGSAQPAQSADIVPSLELELGLSWLGGRDFGRREPYGREETLAPWPSPGNLGRSLMISKVDNQLKTMRNWAIRST